MITKVIKLTHLGTTLKPCRNLTSESYARLSSGGWRGIFFFYGSPLCTFHVCFHFASYGLESFNRLVMFPIICFPHVTSQEMGQNNGDLQKKSYPTDPCQYPLQHRLSVGKIPPMMAFITNINFTVNMAENKFLHFKASICRVALYYATVSILLCV